MKKIILTMFLAAILAGCGTDGKYYPGQFLKTSGTSIVNQQGKEVYLYGYNIGCWLLVEPWMIKMDNRPGIKAGKDIFDKLERRFGTEKGMELYRTYVDNFITEQDIADIASLGMNFIRVPFWYGALFDPKYSKWECRYLDRIIGWAKAHRLYVLIDLHGAPGGQNTGVDILGENVPNRMWSSPEKMDLTVKIWKRLAEKYKNETTVAGYDILNEAWGAPSLPFSMKSLTGFYDVLYKAIREVDKNHMIFIEDGLQGIHRMPRPSAMGWENVVYSFHYYPNPSDPKAFKEADGGIMPNLRRAQMYFNVPFHVGEFNSYETAYGGIESMSRLFNVFRNFGWSWNIWSYKKIEDSDMYSWGLTGYIDTVSEIDLDTASYERIEELFKSYHSSRLKKNTLMETAIRDFSGSLKGMKTFTRIRDDLVLVPEEGEMTRSKTGNITLEWKGGIPNYGWWGDNDSVSWQVNVPSDGVYAVLADYAFGSDPSFKPSVDVLVDGLHQANFTVAATGGWEKYKTGMTAAVRLSKGRHILTMTTKKVAEGVMNLRSVELALSNSLPVSARTENDNIRLLPIFFQSFGPADYDVCVEWQNTPGNIGHWADGNTVTWSFESDTESVCGVSFNFATPYPAGSSRMEITANNDGRTVTAKLPYTGSWTQYQRVEAGRVKVNKGSNTITLKVFTKIREGAGNLGEIVLQKTR